MKKTISLFLALFVTLSINAQIKGNKNIITETFPLEAIKVLEINLTADITVDMKGKNEISITTDSNLIPSISRKVKGETLSLDQKEWIAASQQIKVVIGAPALKKIMSDAHSDIIVKNIEVLKFKAVVNVGELNLFGSVQDIQMENHVGKIDASELIAQNAEIRITSWGKITANVVNRLTTILDEDAKFRVVNEPKELIGDYNNSNTRKEEVAVIDGNIRFINFELKNNSWNRHQFMVVGPKPDGSSFSYGFPMNPGQIRKKNWTIGTKVYQTNRWGLRKLVLTIEAADEGKTVKIY